MSYTPSYAVGALVAIGGVMGFVNKGSLISLFAGLAFGGVIGYSGFMIHNGQILNGHQLAAAVSVALACVMGMRFAKSGKVMPAGAVAGVAIASAFYHINKVMTMKKLA
eukprot:TRINITY_DN387_c0_g1_i1.p1 TRINITY_DN387_c0_g1~~TRINITY_DN387_c0_g1_i1.p1  ORF type:complete len:109 (-),score=23.78 TRINITY_DN387_c0_g1_i1:51-377(-)